MIAVSVSCSVKLYRQRSIKLFLNKNNLENSLQKAVQTRKTNMYAVLLSCAHVESPISYVAEDNLKSSTEKPYRKHTLSSKQTGNSDSINCFSDKAYGLCANQSTH